MKKRFGLIREAMASGIGPAGSKEIDFGHHCPGKPKCQAAVTGDHLVKSVEQTGQFTPRPIPPPSNDIAFD